MGALRPAVQARRRLGWLRCRLCRATRQSGAPRLALVKSVREARNTPAPSRRDVPSRCLSATRRLRAPSLPSYAGRVRPPQAPTASRMEHGPPPPPPAPRCCSGSGPPSRQAALLQHRTACVPPQADPGNAALRTSLAYDSGSGRHPPPYTQEHRRQDACGDHLPRTLGRPRHPGLRASTRVRPITPRARQPCRARRCRARRHGRIRTPRPWQSCGRTAACERPLGASLGARAAPFWRASSRPPRRTFGQVAPLGAEFASRLESPKAVRSQDSSSSARSNPCSARCGPRSRRAATCGPSRTTWQRCSHRPPSNCVDSRRCSASRVLDPASRLSRRNR